jgi:hypothetical protein
MHENFTGSLRAAIYHAAVLKRQAAAPLAHEKSALRRMGNALVSD